MLPIARQMLLEQRIFADIPVLLVGGVDYSHPVGQEIRHIDDPPVEQGGIVSPWILELVVGRAADDLRLEERDSLRIENGPRGVRREDIALLPEYRIIAAGDGPALKVQAGRGLPES